MLYLEYEYNRHVEQLLVLGELERTASIGKVVQGQVLQKENMNQQNNVKKETYLFLMWWPSEK